MKKGQTLVILLVFMATAIIITTAAVAVMVENSQMINRQESGEIALAVAESGAEDMLMRLLRNPSYRTVGNGDTLTVGSGTATIVVSGVNPIITATGTFGNFVRQVRVTTTYSGGILTVNSWSELWP